MNKTMLAQMSEVEKKIHIEELFIKYPRWENVRDKIKFCHENSKISKSPKCLFIGANPGVGKSSIRKQYEAEYPRRDEDGQLIVPVLAAEVPAQATIKNLASSMLKNMGDPAWAMGSAFSMSARLTEYIKDSKVEICILDEFQNLVDVDSQKVLLGVANWLKEMINSTGVPFVLMGLPQSAAIFDCRDQMQLSRRFLYRTQLDPFKWDTDDNIKEFRGLLKTIDAQLPFAETCGLSDTDKAYRIYYATGGVIHYVMELIRDACYKAFSENKPVVDTYLLGQAFNEVIKPHLGMKLNPFTHSIKSLTDTDPEYEAPEVIEVRGKKVKIREVLNAS